MNLERMRRANRRRQARPVYVTLTTSSPMPDGPTKESGGGYARRDIFWPAAVNMTVPSLMVANFWDGADVADDDDFDCG